MATGTQVGSIYYDLDLDDSKFKKGSSGVKSELQGLEGAFASAEKGSKVFLGAVTAAIAAGGAALGFGIKIAGELESARQGFVALLGSAEKADAVMVRVKKEAATTPFELPGLVKGAQALVAITKDGDKAIDTLLDVGKAVAISGKGSAELDRVIINLQQISATGKVTAMDIRQFQSAIPIFNDIIGAAGLTVEQLQSADNAAELLFEAFKKAGQEGGIAFEGFSSQAGTFNQLWSNLKDSIAIGMSDLVNTSGIFDVVKQALAGLIDTINRFTTPESIKQFSDFVIANGPIIAGIILGGITPAVWALTNAFIGLMAPLIPFMVVGAIIGILVQKLIEHFGGLDQIMIKLQPILDFVGKIFNDVIRPALQVVWEKVQNQLLPALRELWAVLEPILLPVLKVVGAIIGVFLVGMIMLLIKGIELLVDFFTWLATSVKEKLEMVKNFFVGLYNFLIGNSLIPDLINGIKDWFAKLPGMITNALKGLYDAITKPFKEAFEWVKKKAEEVWESLQKLNPFHRESPSLIDNITRGMALIRKQYAGLGEINLPSFNLDSIFNPELATAGFGNTQQDVRIYIDKVSDMQDVSAIGREMGFRLGVEPR
jgi:tape measure domain-containing protein